MISCRWAADKATLAEQQSGLLSLGGTQNQLRWASTREKQFLSNQTELHLYEMM